MLGKSPEDSENHYRDTSFLNQEVYHLDLVILARHTKSFTLPALKK